MNTRLIEERTAYRWLARLQQADPDCDLLKRSIAQIEDRHPDWHPYPPNQSETEDFQFENASYPLSPDKLLSMPGYYWADKLASSLPHDPAHRTLLSPQTQEAVKRDPSWGIDLARATIDTNLIKNPAWYYIITGWDQSDLTESQQSSVLDIIADQQLQSNHGDTIAEHLYQLVRHGGKSYAFKLLHQAESVAESLWPHMKTDTPPSPPESWLNTLPATMVWDTCRFFGSTLHLSGVGTKTRYGSARVANSRSTKCFRRHPRKASWLSP